MNNTYTTTEYNLAIVIKRRLKKDHLFRKQMFQVFFVF